MKKILSILFLVSAGLHATKDDLAREITSLEARQTYLIEQLEAVRIELSEARGSSVRPHGMPSQVKSMPEKEQQELDPEFIKWANSHA